MTLKEFYTSNYPTDELGTEIADTATFQGLFEILDARKEVYEYIGVSDSLVRERIFEKLATIMNVEYNYIYDQWLNT